MRTRKKTSRHFALKAAALVVVVVCGASFLSLGSAQGTASVSSDTIGIGAAQSTRSAADEQAPSAKIAADVAPATADAASSTTLERPSARTISVKDPDPVVALAAVDVHNPATAAKAAEVGTLTPLPTAPRLVPNTAGAGWMTGMASAYDLDTNQGWDATASGVKLTTESVTVAVPESQAHLLGSAVEIVYGDKVVIATITDTGGFEKYGRSLDLAAGVWKAFGS
ncbi:MAG: hypothetical protein RR204_07530, partial [Raoultibacter sp.]